jgi:hypothetical protein
MILFKFMLREKIKDHTLYVIAQVTDGVPAMSLLGPGTCLYQMQVK